MLLALTLTVSFAPGGTPAATRSTRGGDWTPLLEGIACRTQVASALEAWNASREAFRAPSGLDGADRYRIPTSKLGVWVTLEASSDGRVRLFRNSARSGIALDFSGTCNPSKRELPGLAVTTGRSFTDADLQARVVANDRLVVYLWTPHLPLSVEGYHQIVEATSSSGAALVAVVDPSSEEGYVREVADAEGIPVDARRYLASVELLFRDLAVHAPAILVFDGGRAHPVLPGYRSAKAYEEYLNALEHE